MGDTVVMPNGNEILEAVAPLVEDGEFIVQALVLVHIVTPNGDDILRLLPTEMPWWTVNGMLLGASILVDDISENQ